MSTERRTDMGEFVLIETGHPTVENPTAWFSSRVEWKPGTSGDNERTLRDQATAAFTANRTFVALASPTNAQVAAQVKALTRQVNGVMRLLLQQFDGTD